MALGGGLEFGSTSDWNPLAGAASGTVGNARERWRLSFALMFSVATVAACGICRAADIPSGPLKAAIAAIRFQEEAVHNIRIAASAQTWQLNKARTKMVPAGGVKSASLYDGLPRGKFLIRVYRDTAPWSNGKGSFSFSTFALGYDGGVGTFLQTVDGTLKHRYPIDDGRVMGRNPLSLYGYLDYDDGWAESIFGFTSFPEFVPPYHMQYRRFSAYLATGQPLTRIRARFVIERGTKLLRVTRVGPPLGKDVFFLDPKHGYSIVRYDFYGFTPRKGPNGNVMRAPNGRDILVPGTHPHAEFRVAGFLEPRPGVFFPKRITRLGFAWWTRNSSKIVMKTSITISKVSVNVPKVNDRSYEVAFPRGAVIIDVSTGRKFIIPGTPDPQAAENPG
jgi:hypothetical protein